MKTLSSWENMFCFVRITCTKIWCVKAFKTEALLKLSACFRVGSFVTSLGAGFQNCVFKHALYEGWSDSGEFPRQARDTDYYYKNIDQVNFFFASCGTFNLHPIVFTSCLAASALISIFQSKRGRGGGLFKCMNTL